jgi:purine-binding chemotaxis protein CheW
MVESIVKMQAITRLPHAPDYIEGVTNLRGAVLPVIDLRKRFGMDTGQLNEMDNQRIMVTVVHGTKIGMVVDDVSEVLRVPQDSIEPPPPMVTTVESTYITGIAQIDERLVILLQLDKVLGAQQVEALPVSMRDN